ncbi:asparagine synthase (glutamine-hydrolyzing) [Methylobacterium nonmethylotrophicum]|uniref:asparagine synthase (glutamine-hydrolyzing) n=1 Tax=Methylobacterium nonmethylotrophicum TaxID=1141884 RepID=A0A4Z0NPS7_9HYPH|nr:asparagine synthase (glutamine-hydrolyzing) [Methylobacterium nonmethylotrophicum]TGD98922.1 asparagine synthase (glutamine-hydrolyzing) [Methylobacterium nonmethylotrophicum]
MCGIAGLLDLAGTPRPAAERAAEVEAMLDRLAHRGPDEAGVVADARVALGAVRLRIVDLALGQQPMGDESGRWWIAFNGEVYNFPELRAELEAEGAVFRSRCDTEVVLRAWMQWGEAAASRLEGGFAFALHDRRARCTHLVRDRAGKRPLFYREEAGGLVFASEMKAFFARPGYGFAWDEGGLSALFGQWTPFGEATPYRGIRQVPAGGSLRVDPTRIRLTRYAEMPLARGDAKIGFEAAAERARALLRGSVARRLRGDVEVAVLLSGGLDSAVVAHLAAEAGARPPRAFSVGFTEAAFDESADQDLVAGRLGLDHDRLVIGPGDIAAAFEPALWHAEIPQFRTAFVPIYRLAGRIREAGCKVVLSGEGADEVFYGYDLFKETALRAEWPALDAETRRSRLRRLYPYLPHFATGDTRALEALFARSSAGADDPLYSHALRFENGRLAQRLLRVAPQDGALPEVAAGLAGLDPVARAQWLETRTLMEGYLLSSQGDRMTFAHGVEPRNPFLAPDVTAFAAGLPRHFHLTPEDGEKRLLKAAFADVLPARILEKPKQPYRAPDAAAFADPAAGRLIPWVEDALAPASLGEVGPVEAGAALRLVDKVRRSGGAVSPRENQAFLLLLSLVLLDGLYVRGTGRERRAPRPPCTRAVLRDAA